MDDLGEFLIMGEALARIEVRDIAAGHECALTGACENDDADFVIALEALERDSSASKVGISSALRTFGRLMVTTAIWSAL